MTPAGVLAQHGLRFAALGWTPAGLDLRPLGVDAEFLDARRHPEWVARYHAANQARFTGALALPGWVLADLYLLPSAIGLVLDGDAIAAAYYAAPTLEVGTVIGVSLLSLREGIGAGWAAKALTLALYRAQVQRGVAQWRSRAVGVHCRIGPLTVEGPAPAVHGAATDSFVYRLSVGQPEAPPRPHRPIPVEEAIRRMNAGESLTIRTPGSDGTRVWVDD